MRTPWLAAIAVAATLLTSCSGESSTGVDGGVIIAPEAQLNFLRPATGLTLSAQTRSFWAVKGQDREVAMYYRPLLSGSDSVRFLRFRVRGSSLLARPDGSAFATGDSVLITISTLDFARLITQFLPSGLTFNPQQPAELRLDFKNANQDFNRDGVVNQADATIAAGFAIWKQEAVGLPWQKLTSAVEISGGLSEVKADVGSFTNHAIAY